MMKTNIYYLTALFLAISLCNADAQNFQWVKKAGGSGSDQSYGIVVDGSGNSYISGWFSDTAYFNGTTLISNGQKDIFLANTLVSTTAAIAALIGIGFGAIIFETYGTTTAFNLDAATFFISALAVFFIVVSNHKGSFYLRDIVDIGKDVVTTVKKSFIFEFKEGLRYIWTSEETKYAFKMFLFAFSYIGSLYVVFIRFIQETLSSLVKDVGFTVVFLAAGIFFGSLLYGRIAHKLDIKKSINASMFISSLYIIFFVMFLKAYPKPLHAIILGFGLGLTASPVIVGINALIHKESDNNLLGRIFSGLEFISHLGFLIAMLICSLLADIFTPFTIMVSVGIIGALVSLIFIAKNDSPSRT